MNTASDVDTIRKKVLIHQCIFFFVIAHTIASPYLNTMALEGVNSLVTNVEEDHIKNMLGLFALATLFSKGRVRM